MSEIGTASAIRRRLDLRQVLCVGLFWLPVGMACAPGHDPRGLYNWTLGLLLYAPSLWLLLREPRRLGAPWLTRPPLLLCLALLVWSGITLFWANGSHPAERLKGPLFVLLYLSGWLTCVGSSPQRALRLLYLSALALALCALAAMLAFPWRDIVWQHRMVGLGLLDGPNLSAYAMGAAFIWLSQLPPARGGQRWMWLIALATLLVFVCWTGSRGAWFALFVCLVGMPLWRSDRFSRWFAALALAGAALVIALDPIELLHRGLSYRPAIYAQAVDMIARHPWMGLGLGSDYTISVGTQSWTHSHSLFTNVAIEMGLPALILWLALWCWALWQGWRQRRQPLGRVLLVLWIFATVALLVDGPMLLHTPRAEWLLTWLPLAIALQLALFAAPGDADEAAG